MKQAGAALGFGRYADAITQTASGNYEVRDPAMRSEILKLRNDPAANALMARRFHQEQRIGAWASASAVSPARASSTLRTFSGSAAARGLIELAASKPNAKAADYFPSAAQANPSIFYDRSTGAARTLAQVRDILTARYDVARGAPGLCGCDRAPTDRIAASR